MRRPALLIAGVLLATGASLALASPASAAPATPAGHGPGWHDNNYNHNYGWYHHHRRHHHHHYYNDYNHNWSIGA